MRGHIASPRLLAACITALVGTTAGAASNEELEQRIETLERQLEATAEAIDRRPAQARDKVHIGGYGELHYNNWNGEGGASDKEELDFHRFVLYFGYDFNERIRFVSELELEHALVEDTDDGSGPGEIELEQAYVEFDVGERTAIKGGLFLIPVGILNETHEPTTFFGVERNPIERNIIPTTWWEGGGLVWGQIGQSGLRYDLALSSGLEVDPTTVSIRGGRQKVAKAKAENLAATGRLRYRGIPGLEVAGTVQFQDDITQDDSDDVDEATLVEAHVDWRRGDFGLRALYAVWDIAGDGAEAIGADRQEGYYIEPSYRFGGDRFGIFARYNKWDNRAGDGGGDTEEQQVDFGVNYWPHPQVVVKADIQTQDNDDGENQDGFNLGIGYYF
jgi:hypothetical protein